jgi:hypothetical protein
MMACLIVTFDRNTGDTRCAFNQLKLAGRGAARNAAVHLQRSKQFVILSNNTCRTKSMQTKMRCDPGNCGMICCIVIRQANERIDVANLKIESTADSIEYFPKGYAGRNRPEKLFFGS